MTNLPVPTWAQVVPGQYDTSALFNTVSNNGSFLTNQPLFKGHQSAAQSIANATVVSLALDVTDTDSYGGHSNVTNNSRYTVQTGAAGWYLVIAEYAAAAHATGNQLVRIAKNGSYIAPSQTGVITAGTGLDTNIQTVCVVQLAAGDYVEATAYQTSGGALNTTPSDTGMTVFWIHA